MIEIEDRTVSKMKLLSDKIHLNKYIGKLIKHLFNYMFFISLNKFNSFSYEY